MQSNRTFPRKVDRERITIGSFLAHRFGLRILTRGVFSKRVRNMLATTFFILGIFMFGKDSPAARSPTQDPARLAVFFKLGAI